MKKTTQKCKRFLNVLIVGEKKLNWFLFSPFSPCYIAVQHERGPRKPKSKPIAEMTTNPGLQDLRTGRPMAPAMPEPRHGSTPPTPPITLVSSSMYYGTFYHSLLTAEQCNVSPMALDLSARRESKGPMSVRVESTLGSGGHPECLPEVAARLLFSSVKWAKSIPCFRLLPFRDQVRIYIYIGLHEVLKQGLI